MAKVLVVEDDPATAFVVKEFLEQKGHSIDHATNAKDAIAFLDTYFYNVILLDWHLQTGTGIEVLTNYRQKGGKAPVLMMTSRGSIDDKETGFESGADDYLQKPFLGKELILRVEALLRRAPAMTGNQIVVGHLKIDPAKRKAYADNNELPLRPKEFALLEHLMRHPDFVFSAESLLNAVWPSDENPSELAVRVTIKRLRQAIQEAIQVDPIETVHGMGYKLKAE
ncbi:MAG: response regulator transcription factor [Candidatus Obscuribacterales bacterium]|nr:response regulator transcription factor [Candidatus Obscuribacterales bacterium]